MMTLRGMIEEKPVPTDNNNELTVLQIPSNVTLASPTT